MTAHKPTSPFHASRPVLLAAVMALGALGITACQSPGSSTTATQSPGKVDLSSEATAKATVLSVDKATRQIMLRDEDGGLFAVECGPAVRNFDQIVVGDQLSVRYQETLSASLRPAGEAATPAAGAVGAGRAKLGDKPAGMVGMAVSVRVKIESVDRTNHIVVFSLSSGELRTVRAQRPEGRAFVETLKIGDIVQLDYTASLALAIDKI